MIRKILFLSSNPTDTSRLRLDKEVREVENGLRRSNERDSFDLVKVSAARMEELRRSLLDHSPHIVHFAGHGGGADGLAVEDDQELAISIPNEALANLFSLCTDHVQCVVLNACYSETQASAICQHIPYVIGMSSSISDEAALEFAVAFYDALGAGRSIEQAFGFGRNAIALKGIPEESVPVLRAKDMSDAEKGRVEGLGRTGRDLVVDISATDADKSPWRNGDGTVVRYSVAKEVGGLNITAELDYVALFDAGGPISPLNYITSTLCPFRWDFPALDIKAVNNGATTRFLTEVVLDVEESRPDLKPLLAIRRDSQKSHARDLLLINEGWCDLIDIEISFNLLPGEVANPHVPDGPYRHSIEWPLLSDRAEIDVTSAFQAEGVDIAELILITNGQWETRDTFLMPPRDGPEKRLSRDEYDTVSRRCLGAFHEYVGTLVGEISFATTASAHQRRKVRFSAVVYLANSNLMGVPRPASAEYGAVFETEKQSYQRRVQISHELQPGEADRFLIRIAVARSSFHRFHATVHDISGRKITSPVIELGCFIPRSVDFFVRSRLRRAG